MLVSRYLLAFTGFELQNTVHAVVLDDTLSMTDHHREEGGDEDENDVKPGHWESDG